MADLKVVPFREETNEEHVQRQTHLQFLEEFVEDVRAGKIQPKTTMIFYLDEKDVPHYWTKNCTIAEQIAFGALVSQQGLNEWKAT